MASNDESKKENKEVNKLPKVRQQAQKKLKRRKRIAIGIVCAVVAAIIIGGIVWFVQGNGSFRTGSAGNIKVSWSYLNCTVELPEQVDGAYTWKVGGDLQPVENEFRKNNNNEDDKSGIRAISYNPSKSGTILCKYLNDNNESDPQMVPSTIKFYVDVEDGLITKVTPIT